MLAKRLRILHYERMSNTEDIKTALTIHEAIEAEMRRRERGPWVPACGGTETPVTVGEYRYLYMFQPSTRRHAYYCMTTDMFLSDDEADQLFGR